VTAAKQRYSLRDRVARRVLRARSRLPRLRRRSAAPPTVDGRTLDARIHVFGTVMAAAAARNAGEEVTVEAVREGFVSMSFIGSADPVAAVSVHDRSIPGPGGDIAVRLYHPPAAAGRAPGIVWFHQGGGVVGGLDTDHTLCSLLAERCAAVVVSVDYRLAPEHPLAARILDAQAGYQWALDNAEGIGIDPARVAVAGTSEGGRLASVVCQQRRRQGLAQPVGQVLVYPGVDALAEGGSMLSMAQAWPLTAEVIAFFVGHNHLGDDDPEHWHSPLRNPALTHLAPAVVVTAGFDPLRDQGDAYAAALRDAGVEVTHRCEDSLPHSFTIMGGVSAEARRATGRLVVDVAALLGSG